MKINMKTSITAGHDALDAAEVKFDFDRSKWLNASEAGTCIRKQWYKKHEPDSADPEAWGYARRGHNCEDFMVAGLRAANVPLDYAGKDQITLQDKKSKCSATGDGIIIGEDEWTPVDLKSIDPRFNKANFPKRHHVTQLQISMELIDMHIDRPDGVELNSGLLIYMDASNYDDIVQFEVPRDHGILERMSKRANKILKTTDVGRLDREGKMNGGKECRVECEFKTVCLGSDLPEGKKRGNRGSALDTVLGQYVAVVGAEKEAKLQRAALKETITKELENRGASHLHVGDITVSLEATKGRITLDKRGMQAAGIDLSPYEKVGRESTRLTVKETA